MDCIHEARGERLDKGLSAIEAAATSDVSPRRQVERLSMLDELERLVAPEPSQSHILARAESSSLRPSGLYFSDLLDHIPDDNDFLINGILRPGHSMAVPGLKGEFKTISQIDAALSLATGKPFLNHFKVRKPCRVLYCTFETTRRDIVSYLTAMASYKGCDIRDVLNSNLQVFESRDHISMRPTKQQKLERKYWSENRYDVVFIDTLSKAIDPSCSFKDGRLTQHGMMAIERHFGSVETTFVYLMHYNKSADKHRSKADIAGVGVAEHVRSFLMLQKLNEYQPGHPYLIGMTLEANGGYGGKYTCAFTEGWGPKGTGYSTTVTGGHSSIRPKVERDLIGEAVKFANKTNKPFAKTALRGALKWNTNENNKFINSPEFLGKFEKIGNKFQLRKTGQDESRACPDGSKGQ